MLTNFFSAIAHTFPRPCYISDRATIHSNLGETYRSLGLSKEAERTHRASLALRLRIHADNHPQVQISRNHLAFVLWKQGHAAKAQALLEGLKLESGSLLEAAILHTKALASSYLGDMQAAQDQFAASLEIRERLLPASHPVMTTLLSDYAELLHKRKLRKAAALISQRARSSAAAATISWKALQEN